MKVAHLLNSAAVGGTETMLHKLISNTPQLSHYVVPLVDSGVVGEKIARLGTAVDSFDVVRRGRPSLRGLWRLTTAIREFKPDVIQTWAYYSDLVGAYLSKRLARPVVWSIRHGTLDPTIDSTKLIFSARLGALISSRVPHCIVFNSRAAQSVARGIGYDEDKMVYIPNGFELHRFKPSHAAREQLRAKLGLSPSDRLVGMCARFHPHKGHRDFVAAAGILAARYRNVHFALVGRHVDPSNLELQQLVNATGSASRFHLLGPWDQTETFYPALDAFVLPSVTEAMPNVVGEAMACGIFCVVTDVGDARHLVGDAGAVVPVGDVHGMAAAVENHFDTPAPRRRQLGRIARERIASKFDICNVTDQFVDVWRQAAESSWRRSVLRSSGVQSRAA